MLAQMYMYHDVEVASRTPLIEVLGEHSKVYASIDLDLRARQAFDRSCVFNAMS